MKVMCFEFQALWETIKFDVEKAVKSYDNSGSGSKSSGYCCKANLYTIQDLLLSISNDMGNRSVYKGFRNCTRSVAQQFAQRVWPSCKERTHKYTSLPE